MAVLVGILAGLAAAGLHKMLELGTHALVGNIADLSGLKVFRFDWLILLLPVLGGLASGLVVTWLVPQARGHGTNALIRAFHHELGVMPIKGPLVRAMAAVGVISCGGCSGPEGPIAGFGAAIGSSVGGLFRLTPRERRVLLLAGCAAGVGAIFQCPLGGALFATSVLYIEEEFEGHAMVPAFVASVIGYTTFKTVLGGLGSGGHLLASSVELKFAHAAELIPYALLGPLCGVVSIFLAALFHGVERRLMPRSPLPAWLSPAIGGLATGALACVLPQVMDGRYEFIQHAMTGFPGVTDMSALGWGRLALLFAAVALAKCIANVFTVGSGGSGGNFGPCVFIGGAVGAFLGASLHALFPGLISEPLRQALIPVGIGGMLAASMRTPVAAMVMVTEMTGSYGLIVPLMLVCMSAYVVGRRWGLNWEQVPTAAQSPAHAGDLVVQLLEQWKVRDLMEPAWSDTVAPETPLREMVGLIRPGTRPVFAVARNGNLVGIVSLPDIRRVLDEPGLAELVIAGDIMTERLDTVFPDQDVYHALEQFRRSGHVVLPVVSRDRRQWLGMLSRERVFESVRDNIVRSHALMFREHSGLSTLEQEGQLQNLIMGVNPLKQDMIQRLLVPMDAVGLSLRQADFRRKYGAQVIAVEEPDGRIQCPPDLDAPLQTGQRLLAVVWYDRAANPTSSNAS